MEQHPVTDYKATCIKPDCNSQEFSDVFDKEGNISPARKCKKCGLLSTMFFSKL